jgi:zinc protease
MRGSWLALWLSALAAAPAAAAEVREHMLDNGLKVLVKEDHRAPVVVSQVWYKVGSSYEHRGITGISHVLEHMMFKGTERHPAGEFSEIIAANGGEHNAFTGRDYTAYFQTLARDRLEVAFELEADRMRNLTLPEDEFLKEVEVVKEERRLRTEDKPQSLTFEEFNAVAYRSSPYRQPVIGWMNDLDNLEISDLEDWYRRWYAPNNATLVVVGDVDPDEVIRLAEKHFGPLQPERVAPPKAALESPQRGIARLQVRVPARQPYLLMGYKTTAVGHAAEPWEPYALEMLASILDGGASARIARKLIRSERVAASAGADYSAFTRLPGMLLMDGTPADGRSVEELEEALRAEVERLREELVSEEELERVRNQVVASKVYERDSVFYQAMQLGVLETVGLDWRLLDRYVERISAVTAEQVRAVARKYLTDKSLTVGVLDPLPQGEARVAVTPEPVEGARHAH